MEKESLADIRAADDCSDADSDACQKCASGKPEDDASPEEKYPLGAVILATGEQLLLKNR